MSKYFERLNNAYSSIDINKDDFLLRLTKAYSSKEKLEIKSTSELEYLWSVFPFSMDLRKNFIYPFDPRTKDISKFSYSKNSKDLCADLLLNHFKDSLVQSDIEAELILNKYFEIQIDYLSEIKRLEKLNLSKKVISKWVQYGSYYSKDPEFYIYAIERVKKQTGYLKKKYRIASSAIENSCLSPDLNKVISKFATKRNAKDMCWKIKSNLDKKLDSKGSKHFYNLKHKYKKKYEDENIISDDECNLCVLLTLKGGPDVCDIVTAFLPEKYCVFIFPLCTNQTSINNLKRRSIL